MSMILVAGCYLLSPYWSALLTAPLQVACNMVAMYFLLSSHLKGLEGMGMTQQEFISSGHASRLVFGHTSMGVWNMVFAMQGVIAVAVPQLLLFL